MAVHRIQRNSMEFDGVYWDWTKFEDFNKIKVNLIKYKLTTLDKSRCHLLKSYRIE